MSMMPREGSDWTWWKTSAVAGVVVTGSGGTVILLNRVSETVWLLALNLFVVGVLALLVSAIGAWVADTEATIAPAAPGEPPARLTFVVRRNRTDLYGTLEDALARHENVQVLMDRREHPRDAFDREVLRRGWSVNRSPVTDDRPRYATGPGRSDRPIR